jgi:long-chain acyl-CoA synthetase
VNPGSRPQTSIGLVSARASDEPHGIATFHRLPSGEWASTTWLALWEEVRHTAAAFAALGLQRGDKLAIISHTCREWQLAELAAALTGAVVVGVDAHAASEQVRSTLKQAQPAALVIDTPENLAKIDADVQRGLKFALVLDDGAVQMTSGNTHSWRIAMSRADTLPAEPSWTPGPDEPATLIYTSGTTGTPKGIEYAHGQVMAACWAMVDEFPEFEGARVVCWLPMSALFQRMTNLVACANRSITYFVEDPRQIVARLAEIKPTVFTSVPRFYEKVHDGIQEQLFAQAGIRKDLIQAALAAGAEWARLIRAGQRPGVGLRLRHAVLDRLVLRRLRAVMGGEMQWMISGSAAAPVWLLEFFHSIGLPMLEAYGITENPIPIAANRASAYRFGSVGKPFPENLVRLAEDREVLVKGNAMFHHYFGEERIPDRFTADGYYRTGDYGRFDAEGFLYLTGRSAEMIKTSTGRRVAPVAIEGVYRRSRYVDQIVVVGNDRPHLAALVSVNASAVGAALAQGSRSPAAESDIVSSAAMLNLIHQDFDRLGSALARHEQIHAIAILPAPFSIENGELTSSLKPRRDRIEARYSETIDALYAGKGRPS